jgi:hypothetical protein
MTTSTQTSVGLRRNVAGGRRYFTVMALVMIAISIAGFLPAIVDPASRRAPLTPLAGVHGVVCSAYLVLFFVQTRLIAAGRVAVHRRLGAAGVFLLSLLIPLAYVTTIEMVHRGFDLSGDQGVDSNGHGALDAEYGAAFNLVALALFAVLAAAGLALRRRSEIHKRLMLYANIELMGAPVTHFWGHTGAFNHVSVPVGAMLVLAPMAILMFSCVVRDFVLMRRVRPLTATLAIILFAMLPIQAGVIGPSAWWHHLVDWLAR